MQTRVGGSGFSEKVHEGLYRTLAGATRSILSRNFIPAASSRRKGAGDAGVRDLFFPYVLPPLSSPRCWSRPRECNFRARSKNPARCGIRHVRHRYNSFDETVEMPSAWLSNCGANIATLFRAHFVSRQDRSHPGVPEIRLRIPKEHFIEIMSRGRDQVSRRIWKGCDNKTCHNTQ